MDPYISNHNVNPEYKSKIYTNSALYKMELVTNLKDYLTKNSDFDEIYFFENEREFYAKLYHNCCTISNQKDIKTNYLKQFAPDILKKLTKTNNEWDYNYNEECKAGFRAIINYLDQAIEVDKNRKKHTHNPYSNIFSDGVAFHIFEQLHLKFFESESQHKANYSFIYRKMKNDNFIKKEVRNSDYINFVASLEKPVSITAIKTMSEISDSLRNEIYLLIVQPFRLL